MVYAVDFDGTLCTNEFPEIGAPRHDIINFVKRRRAGGDKIILWTCRSGENLESALEWCCAFGLAFDAVNDNLPENIACNNNNSRKVNADFYIDDRNYSPPTHPIKEWCSAPYPVEAPFSRELSPAG